ncbi:unnamed protein product [Medioppia subpectinata]|uniref:ER-bound oxygenase mpaB/mpaB'/Rubber oxygenase catalytic domain-containing protein n=1 Tax=Medioppia subpectinata TaxID=1979941 RepID=A0A7R9KK94_9ACAR|nr:unnamed protein product [Medioppia subpectinata]CAG2103852.1 unnamed protein product [Medioppia subpectinata]
MNSVEEADSRRREVLNGAQRRYQELKTSGYFAPGICDDYELNKVPSWFDPTRYERCIYLARKYFVSLYIAHFIGLLMIIQIPSGLAPLLATGNSETVAKLFRRYLSTLIHVRNWYESNPFDTQSVAFKSIQKVRAMHKRVAQLMNTRPKTDTIKDKLWLNQYDFAMTQWAFIGPVILYPEECGLRPATAQDIDDLCYLWRVIGYCMGIEDKYNLCSANIEEDRELCRLLFDRDYRPVLHDNAMTDTIGWQMGNGIALGLQMLNPSLSFEAIINYWYPRLEIPHKIQLKTFFHKFSYYYLWFNFQVMLRYSMAHWLYGWVYRLLIALAIKKRHIRENILRLKYKDIKYEEKCPLNNIKLEYTDAFNENL